jgi:HEAT repeat protein
MAREAASARRARGQALIRALEDRSVEVRRNAVESRSCARDAVPSCGLVERDLAVGVQRAAITALARLGDARAVPVLVRHLDARRDAPPLDAIWALGEIGDPSAVAILSELRRSGDVYVSYNASRACADRELTSPGTAPGGGVAGAGALDLVARDSGKRPPHRSRLPIRDARDDRPPRASVRRVVAEEQGRASSIARTRTKHLRGALTGADRATLETAAR